ncbi:serine hydrolase [Actinomadura sp. 3N508]|uniref:serine hydrolase n=1 Tax=Actinomadura sp. 3N508 TaxID=3375153 RepID=UPI0037B12475
MDARRGPRVPPADVRLACGRDRPAPLRQDGHLLAGRILRPDTLRDAIRPRASGPDRTMLVDSTFGLGFMRPAQTFATPEAARRSAFGHAGAGGSIGLADPDAGLALAYLPNLMSHPAAGDLRAYRLTEAAYASVG